MEVFQHLHPWTCIDTTPLGMPSHDMQSLAVHCWRCTTQISAALIDIQSGPCRSTSSARRRQWTLSCGLSICVVSRTTQSIIKRQLRESTPTYVCRCSIIDQAGSLASLRACVSRQTTNRRSWVRMSSDAEARLQQPTTVRRAHLCI